MEKERVRGNHFTVLARPESIEFQSFPLAVSSSFSPAYRRANVCQAAGSNRTLVVATLERDVESYFVDLIFCNQCLLEFVRSITVGV